MRSYRRAGAPAMLSRGDHGHGSHLTRPAAAIALQRMAGNHAVASLASRMLARAVLKDPKTGEFYDDRDPEKRRFATAGEAIGYARAHGGFRPATPGAVGTLSAALPGDVVSHIMGYLDPEDMLGLRASNRAGLGDVEQRTLAAGPPTTETELILGNPYHFPTEFRTQDSTKNKAVGGSEAVRGSWLVYEQVEGGQSPSYVEVKFPKTGSKFPKKDVLFPRHSPQQKSERSAMEKRGQLFSPPKLTKGGERTWTAQINDAWVLGIIHRRVAVRFLADLTWANLWDDANNRPTALGREITQLYNAGYIPVASGSKPTKEDRYAHVGVLLVPPTNAPARPPRLSDALYNQRATVKKFMTDAKSLWKSYR